MPADGLLLWASVTDRPPYWLVDGGGTLLPLLLLLLAALAIMLGLVCVSGVLVKELVDTIESESTCERGFLLAPLLALALEPTPLRVCFDEVEEDGAYSDDVDNDDDGCGCEACGGASTTTAVEVVVATLRFGLLCVVATGVAMPFNPLLLLL